MSINKNNEKLITQNISFMFIIYWAILVLWQNIGLAETRGFFDMLIKIILLCVFVLCYLSKSKELKPKIIVVFFLACFMLITFTLHEPLELNILIAYAFPIIFTSMIYGVGDNFVITKKHLLYFCNSVIIITLYAALYSIFFRWDKFISAFSISNAYGNELTSFFVSSHEYGLYLVAAMVSCFFCLKLTPNLTKKKILYYIFALLLLGVNLILTYSRTSIFSMAIFIVIFIIFDESKWKKWLILAIFAGIIVVLCSPKLYNYFYNIVLKGNNFAGRDELYEGALQYFYNGSIVDKVFGFGIYGSRQFFSLEFGHGSVHNAYFQVLLYYGIIGFSLLLIFLITQFVAGVKLLKKDRFVGTMFIGLVVSVAAMMFTNTIIIFTSPIDSYFATIFMFVVPKYVRNAIERGMF